MPREDTGDSGHESEAENPDPGKPEGARKLFGWLYGWGRYHARTIAPAAAPDNVDPFRAPSRSARYACRVVSSQSETRIVDALADAARRDQALVALSARSGRLEAAAFDAVFALLTVATKTTRRLAAGALAAAVGDPAHDCALRAGLASNDPLQSWGVCFAFASAGESGREVCLAALRALELDDGDVRWAAAEIVAAAIPGDDGFARAVGETASAGGANARKMALYCLRDAGVPAIQLYLDALDATDPGVKLAGLAGLQRCGRECRADSVVRVITCLRADTDCGVRRAAAATLGRITDLSVDTPARAALDEAAANLKDRDLARAARQALAMHGPRSPVTRSPVKGVPNG